MGRESFMHKPSKADPSSSDSSSQRLDDADSPAGVNGYDEKEMIEHHRKDTVQTVSDSEAEDIQPYAQAKHPSLSLNKPRTHTIGILKLRARDDTDPTDWWFASTAIPLIAATFAPMANLLSIAALVVYWRNNVTTPDVPATVYSASVGVQDPKWCLYLNAASLACGFIGNLFLLFNFTKRVRYIIALPVTILFFYIASGILIAITVCMARYTPPGPNQVYSQGYWHAVIAACLYMLNSMILMVNMWGYFLGHYPQNFNLTDEHRNLILQTMLFFIWLGGGAGVFAKTERWEYPDALYFCDVTILTIGFGDYVATDDLSRGLVFPYSVGGTIILGLMVSSIHKFARELSKEKVIRKHVETRRVNTLSRAVTLEELDDHRLKRLATGQRLSISRPLPRDAQRIEDNLNELAKQERLKRRTVNFQDASKADYLSDEPPPETDVELPQYSNSNPNDSMLQKGFRTLALPIVKPVGGIRRVMSRGQKKILMLQERDRFNAMRDVQRNASTFKRYYALTLSIISFGMLWCLGAMVFFFAEASTQELNYFQCLYFCYVSLLTIGYGDLSPRSNSGKAFFVVWSLIAVPAMTILISDLGDTVIGGFKRGVLKNDLGLTSQAKDSPSSWRSYLARLFRAPPSNRKSVASESRKPSETEAGKRKASLQAVDEDGEPVDQEPKTIEELVDEEVSETEMMRRLAYAIRQTADDLKHHPDKQYNYEEWVQFTRLIKFSKFDKAKLRSGEANALAQLEDDEADDGIVEWDWLDAKSPMTSEQSESEWILDRLCESLLRVFKKSDLMLGGLDAVTALQRTRIPERVERKDDREEIEPYVVEEQDNGDAKNLSLEQYSFGASTANATSPSPQTRRRMSDALISPAMLTKVTKFFQGDDVHDGTSQWSRRAKAKMGQAPEIDDNDTRLSSDRRRSSTASPVYRRQGPFAQR